MHEAEKGHMVPVSMGGQARDSACHGVFGVSRCSAVHLDIRRVSGINKQGEAVLVSAAFMVCKLDFMTGDDTVFCSLRQSWFGGNEVSTQQSPHQIHARSKNMQTALTVWHLLTAI